MTSFSIRTFGCRTNQAEAFAWAAELEREGFHRRSDGGEDVVVVNTCTLTSRADRDVRKFLRRTARLNPKAGVVVTGCLAERDPESLRRMPGVRDVLPNAEKNRVPEVVAAARPSGAAAAGKAPAAGRPFRSRAFLKVQDGCDMGCRFCIIPRVRGRGRSVAIREVVDRVGALAGDGFQEIVLTGINLSAYGRDLLPPSSLLDLAAAIDAVPGRFRVRLSSLDPRFVTSETVEGLTRSARICPHFHLSLQSGADPVLRAMGRRRTAADDRALLAEFARRSPEAAIGADIIVGFPGEREEDFEASLSLVRDGPLSYVHIFPFSPRPGTPAAEDPPVDEAVKRARTLRLRRAAGEKNTAFRRRFAGRVLEGVIVGRSFSGDEALTSNDMPVALPPSAAALGTTVRVRILRVSDEGTAGEIAGASFPDGHEPD
ncbi:MAG: tRNA (N(6)-L-threonylcarbamoyladenosine(37)-C(2))-methylthiotransferase MtaB [Candidatus Aminicenantes bacterium]|nr:tRNA (N(6)-L-threonylcarbamoyladenosine(37)-C(2))-methylthiotransferase MtaB [Candidatus Aminicenantes bacterium]